MVPTLDSTKLALVCKRPTCTLLLDNPAPAAEIDVRQYCHILDRLTSARRTAAVSTPSAAASAP